MHLDLNIVLPTLYVVIPLILNVNLISGSRTSSNPRPRLKCLKNVTTIANADTQMQAVHGNAKCVTLSQPYCLDIKLPYNSIALLDTFPDLNLKSYEDVQLFLDKWRGAQKLPGCWPTLQMALCSLLMPKCEEDPLTGRAVQFHQPNADICLDLTNVNKTNCKLIQKALHDEWSTLFDCSDANSYAKNCTNEVRELRHSIRANTKPTCQSPLVSTNDSQNWFRDIEGCSLNCKFPISNPNHQGNINLMIEILCLIGLVSISGAILLSNVNKASSKSSRIAKVVEHCTICHVLIYLGWSLQFLYTHGVGCKPDGSPLNGQPLVANSCILSFILTYVPSLSGLFWCAHLGKLCHAKLIGQASETATSAKLDWTLSLFNYGTPLTLFVSVAFLGQIDGNGLFGICTVGQQSPVMKTVFEFVPRIVGTIYGNYFFVRIIFKLAFFRKKAMKPSLRRNFIRILALSLATTIQIVCLMANYWSRLRYESEWSESLVRYVECQLNPNNYDGTLSQHELARQQQECTISSTPFTSLYYLEVLSTLVQGIVIASWNFHEPNYRGLKRKLINALADDKERKRLAQAYCALHEQSCASDRRGMLTAGPGKGSEVTYYDLIDMASPTRCADHDKRPDNEELELDVNNNTELEERQNDVPYYMPHQMSAVSSRCTSVSSITFCTRTFGNSVAENSSSSIPNRHKKGINRRDSSYGFRSRDVINDIRQQRTINIPDEQNPDPEKLAQLMKEWSRVIEKLSTGSKQVLSDPGEILKEWLRLIQQFGFTGSEPILKDPEKLRRVICDFDMVGDEAA